MKKHTAIIKEIKKTRAHIEALKAEIAKLEYTEEKKTARENASGAFSPELRAIYEAARNNAEQIGKLSDVIYLDEIKTRVLIANARAALLAEALPVILEACKPYDGKPYGERTADKIREEVKKHGYGFYFDTRDNSRIEVCKLTKQGYKGYYKADEATGTARDASGRLDSFITEDNRLNIANVATVKPRGVHYVDSPAKEARRINKAMREYMELTKQMEIKRRALCDMIPEGIKEPDYISEYYMYF